MQSSVIILYFNSKTDFIIWKILKPCSISIEMATPIVDSDKIIEINISFMSSP